MLSPGDNGAGRQNPLWICILSLRTSAALTWKLQARQSLFPARLPAVADSSCGSALCCR